MTEIRDVINLLHPKWTIEALEVLAKGPFRYSDLQYQLTLSAKEKVHSPVFTAALTHLQAHGLVEHDDDERQAYRITPDGLELVRTLSRVVGWQRRRRPSRRE